MKLLKGVQTQQKRDEVKKTIISKIANICTSDCDTCAFSECGHIRKCVKDIYTFDKIANNSRTLNALIARTEKIWNKKQGRKSPYSRGEGAHGIANTILGQDIFEHELVKDCPATQMRIKKAKSLGQIANILKQKHHLVTGKVIRFPYG